LKLQLLNIAEEDVIELATLFRFLAFFSLFLFNDKRCVFKDVYKLEIALD